MKFHNNPLETMGPETCQFTLERSLCMPGATWHEFLCKNLENLGFDIFMSLQRIVTKHRIFSNFGAIN